MAESIFWWNPKCLEISGHKTQYRLYKARKWPSFKINLGWPLQEIYFQCLGDISFNLFVVFTAIHDLLVWYCDKFKLTFIALDLNLRVDSKARLTNSVCKSRIQGQLKVSTVGTSRGYRSYVRYALLNR